jgi:hypothetical protein
LATLNLLESLVLLALQIFLPGSLSSGMESIDISSPYVMTVISFLGVFGLATGIGMWTGKKWGWWLSALYLSCGVAMDIVVLLTVPERVQDLSEPEGGAAQYYVEHVRRIIVYSLLILYFFKSNVVEYFQLGGGSSWKRLFLLVGVTAGIMVIFAVGSLFANAGGSYEIAVEGGIE